MKKQSGFSLVTLAATLFVIAALSAVAYIALGTGAIKVGSVSLEAQNLLGRAPAPPADPAVAERRAAEAREQAARVAEAARLVELERAKLQVVPPPVPSPTPAPQAVVPAPAPAPQAQVPAARPPVDDPRSPFISAAPKGYGFVGAVKGKDASTCEGRGGKLLPDTSKGLVKGPNGKGQGFPMKCVEKV